MARRWWAVTLAVVLSVAMPRWGETQTLAGAIVGRVVDADGRAVAGALVTVTEEATNASRVAYGDEATGEFLVTNLPPGTYLLQVRHDGFRTYERRGINVDTGGRVSVGAVPLDVGGVDETVSVTASGTPVAVAETQHSGLITRTQIDLIQVLGRDVTSILRLVPGVRYESTVDSLGMAFGTTIPNVGGAPRDWTNIIVDGLLANEIGSGSLMAQQINLDAIAEVKVLLGSTRAEYGRAGAGQVQIVSRSGTAQYRGSAYYYGRHEKLNAENFFAKRAGIEKAPYRFNTLGANLGGPIPGGRDRRLFFFYSVEAPHVDRPGPLRRWQMPTADELRGDFSKTLNPAGQVINIRDPLRPGPCSPVGPPGPGCFPGNVIPADRINPGHGLALLRMLPAPTLFDTSVTRGAYNLETRTNAKNPKLNNILRVDWRPTGNDSLYVTFKDWYSDQRGSEITFGPSKWGFFDAHALSRDRGLTVSYTRLVAPTLVLDTDVGVRVQTERFDPLTEADWARIERGNVGFTAGQFFPELNPRNVLPKAFFLAPNAPDFSFDNRLVDEARSWLTSVRGNLTWLRGRHAVKAGASFEEARNSEGRGGVGAAPWSGQFTFANDPGNPLNTNHHYANALLGVFREYTEADAFAEVSGRRPIAEGFLQDTWTVSKRLTLDYGMRFLWYAPWHSTRPSAAFVPDRYDPSRAPRLYQPALIGGLPRAFDPVTGTDLPNAFVGTFVPGSGDRYNGMVTSDDPAYPRGFREGQGIEPEGRVGLAWDLTGDGRTALHASAGRYHNPHINANVLDQLARNPPAQNSPTLIYGTIDTLFTPESREAFSLRPSNVLGLERDAKTPTSLNVSVGVQRELGWGTVLDVTYAGSRMRHVPLTRTLNTVPDGARILSLHPENANPQSPFAPKPDDFLRPYQGYSNILFQANAGYADYHALHVQLNRRYAGGLQFAVAYTLAKTTGGGVVEPLRPDDWWNEAPSSAVQLHNLVVNYTWDLPGGSRLWDHAVVRGALDGWQVSGETAFVSGDWAGANFATTDNFDFTGGGAGSRVVITGAPTGGSNRDPHPDGAGRWLDPAAFARPAGRFDLGDAPLAFFRLPWIRTSNVAVFKNFEAGGGRRLQVRWEIYNVFNQVNWANIDTFLVFDPAGRQVNDRFGKATSARDPRIMQGAIRFSF